MIRTAICFVLFVQCCTPLFANERSALPGLSWSFELPPGFKVDNQGPLPTWLGPEGLRVTVYESPPDTSDMSKEFKAGDVKNKGTSDEALIELSRPIAIDGKSCLYAEVSFAHRDHFSSTILCRGKTSNLMAICQMPDTKAGREQAKKIQAMFFSARETPQSDDKRMGQLPYTVGDMQNFRLLPLNLGTIAFFTDGPKNDLETAPEQSSIQVMLSPAFARGADYEGLVQMDKAGLIDNLIMQHYRSATSGGRGPIYTDGVKGYEVQVSHMHEPTGKKLSGFFRQVPVQNKLLMIYAGFPENDPAKEQAVRKFVDSLRVK